jgi:hypothetical protein
MSSIDHIRSTPGLVDWDWPTPMSLEQNLGDLEHHARDFRERTGFTYSILDGDAVIGCLYIYRRAPVAMTRRCVPGCERVERSWTPGSGARCQPG